jgi:hypothetical protein
MSPVRKVLMGLSILLALTGGVTGYLHLTKPEPVKTKVKKEQRKIKRTYKDGKIATEEVQEFLETKWTKPGIKPKPYLFGVTLSYDTKINYNIMAGKQVTQNCYAIGKTSTEFNNIEAGALCVF